MRAEDLKTLSDEELLGLITQRRSEALEALYDRYAGAIFSLAVRMLRDAGAAEEVTQDASFNVWRRASSYRPDRGEVTAWLFSIGHHRVVDEVRRRRRREERQVFQDMELMRQPDEAGNPAKQAVQMLLRGEIEVALSALRQEQREVVVLAYYGVLTHSEIAKRLGNPLGTVKTRMRLGLKKLREVLGKQSQDWVGDGV